MSQDIAAQEKIKPSKPSKFKKKEKRPPKKITPKYLHNAGLGYLQRFAASSAHFRFVMMRKIHCSCGFHKDQNLEECTSMLDELIEKFQRACLLDDTAYARGLVHSLHRRGLSMRAIQMKLKEKGIPAQTLELTLEQHREEHGENADLKAALFLLRRRRLGPFQNNPDEKSQEKALATLARAGFGYGLAQSALEMDMDSIEEILNGNH